jgi:propanol-preferring alcohol dehydrogenase
MGVWYELQRDHDQVYVARQHGCWPVPLRGQVQVRLVACGLCGADVRVQTGNKATHGEPRRFVIPGHEGVGVVAALGEGVVGLKRGDHVVVLPHVYAHNHAARCSTPQGGPTCIGKGCTRHLGWDVDGVFADVMLVQATNLVRVAPVPLQHAAELAPCLPRGALFALVEPLLCVLSSYRMLEHTARAFGQRNMAPGRALVIGSSPIGCLHAQVLLDRGWQVSVYDSVPKRAALAQARLEPRVQVVDPNCSNRNRHVGAFDLVMVTASSASAIQLGEDLVRDDGLVYLFAGLNTADRAAMDRHHVIAYEGIHRGALALKLTRHQESGQEKVIGYVGHSGYWEDLAPNAIAWVATHAAVLDRMVTGLIRGWTSPEIEARLPGGGDWRAPDGSPAICAVLNGTELHDHHLKLLVLPGTAGSQRKTVSRNPRQSSARVAGGPPPRGSDAEASRGRMLWLVPRQSGRHKL